jgi:hypothetical protein
MFCTVAVLFVTFVQINVKDCHHPQIHLYVLLMAMVIRLSLHLEFSSSLINGIDYICIDIISYRLKLVCCILLSAFRTPN